MYLNVYKWTPRKLTGGDKIVASDPSWSCDGSTTTEMSADTWIARSSSVSWNNFFSIAGVTLDATTSNSHAEQLYINIDPNERAKVCGDNDFPASADRVKERIS